MRTFLIALALTVGCSEFEPLPASYTTPGQASPDTTGAVERIHCGGWLAGGDNDVTVYLDGAVWPGGKTWLYAEVAVGGRLEVGMGMVSMTDGRVQIRAGDWTVEYVRSAYPELNLTHPTEDDWKTAGLCFQGAPDPHEGLR